MQSGTNTLIIFLLNMLKVNHLYAFIMVLHLSYEIRNCILRRPSLGRGSEAGDGTQPLTSQSHGQQQCPQSTKTASVSVAAIQLASKNWLPVWAPLWAKVWFQILILFWLQEPSAHSRVTLKPGWLRKEPPVESPTQLPVGPGVL